MGQYDVSDHVDGPVVAGEVSGDVLSTVLSIVLRTVLRTVDPVYDVQTSTSIKKLINRS